MPIHDYNLNDPIQNDQFSRRVDNFNFIARGVDLNFEVGGKLVVVMGIIVSERVFVTFWSIARTNSPILSNDVRQRVGR